MRRKNDVMSLIVTSQRRQAVTRLAFRWQWVLQMRNIVRNYYNGTSSISEDIFKKLCILFKVFQYIIMKIVFIAI